MSVLSLLIAAQFVSYVREDPITLEPQAVYAVTDEDDNIFGLVCTPGKHDIDIRFVPGDYPGRPPSVFLWTPRADSRFGGQAEAEKDSWHFSDTYLSYVSSNAFGYIKPTAVFLDRLANDDTFNIRFEDYPRHTETVTIRYTLDQAEIRDFIAMCEPRKVIQSLQEMGSVVAPSG